ncbi:TRAF3-interacting protein 1 [Dermatophagoides farinae]|uniref:TRAF3-interacting protein 1 n=1 Tax=Dermatophagoides farinae TaxID=6954 RepID=A0A922HSY4_DERFA|nr:TRAF3-interacting protein 1 [Dermatophagoides farinae]
MSQEKINQRLIKSNIDQLSKIVKRPAVTEKILSRPPFRFIFDLTTMIIKTTGYLRGLYSEEEFNFDNVNANKERKMAFLDKLIDVIGLINGKTIDCKSAKIVAGVEVEKTNKLLNEFAKCVLDKKSFLESVEKVRKGSKNTIDKVDNNKEKMTTKAVTDVNDGKIKSKNTKPITKPTTKATAAGKTKQPSQQERKSTNAKTAESPKNEIEKPNIKRKESINEIYKNQIEAQEENTEELTIDSELEIVGKENENRRPSTTTKTDIQNRDEMKMQENDQVDIKTQAVMDDHDDVLGQLSSLDNVNNNDNNPSLMNEPQIMDEELPVTNDNTITIVDRIQLTRKPIVGIARNHNEDISTVKQTEPPVIESIAIHPKLNDLSSSKVITNRDKEIQSNRPKNRENSSTIHNNDLNNNVNTMAKSVADINNRIKSSAATRSARPKSSRPAPPRVMTASRSRLSQLMENRTEQLESESTTTNANVWIPETVDDESDEFLISSQKLQDSFLTMDSNNRDQKTGDADIGQEEFESKGHLVQQLMATKNELEGQIKDLNLESNKSYNQQSATMIDDTNQLKNQIQSLCQSIGTLTKAMGYLHEDVEPMLNELVKWQTEFETNNKIIMKIRAEMNSDLEPLRKELEQTERQVDDFGDQIRMTKANVFRNEQIISNLIHSV